MTRLHSLPVLLFGLALLAAVQAAGIWTDVFPARNGGAWNLFYDSDSYARALRLKDLLLGQNWFDPVSRRLNAPEGLAMHWTRPLDALTFAPAWILAQFVGIDRAVHWIALWFGPVSYLAFVPLLSWVARPYLSDRGFLLACLLFAMLRGQIFQSMAGAFDYHGLESLLMLAGLGLGLRLADDAARPAPAYWLGGLTALGIWITPEMALLMAPAFVALLARWVRTGGDSIAAHCRAGRALAIGLALALALERPLPDWPNAEADRLSAIHVAFGFLAALASEGLRRLGAARPAFRLGAALAAGSGGAVILFSLFPELRHGPFGPLDPSVQRLLMADVLTEESLWPKRPIDAFWFLLDVGPFFVALPWVLARLRPGGDAAERRRYALHLTALLLIGLHAFTRKRAVAALEIAFLLPWVDCVLAFLGAARGSWLWRSAALAAFGWHLAAAALLDFGWLKIGGFRWAPRCQFAEIAPFLDPSPQAKRGTILAHHFRGPEIAYVTGYGVWGAPYHRNGPGIADSDTFFMAESDAVARDLAVKRGLAYVAICRAAIPYSRDELEARPRTLASRLMLKDESPPWLRRVPLPMAVGRHYDLWRVAGGPAN